MTRSDGWTRDMSEEFKREERIKANGICSGCGKKAPRLYADHNHAICPEKIHACPKCFRGMLCSSCNHRTIDWPEGQGPVEVFI